MKRRDFLKHSGEAALLYSFYHLLSATHAWAKPVEPIIQKWIKEIGDISSSVQSGKMSPREWQRSIERLHAKIPLNDIIQFVDLENALKRAKFPKEKIGAIENVKWPEVEGFPKDLEFGHKLFIYRKGSSTPPHAHNHLVSAHLVVKGEIRVRTFDRVEDLDKSILLKPTRNEVAKIGTTVSMSDYQDNVHWFEGVSDISVSFDLPVSPVEPKKEYKHPAEGYNQIFLDASVKARPDGLIEAPIITFADSLKRFASA